MDYLGDIYRPPSEADSLLLQVTTGCSHNRCTFCSMYTRKRFAAKPFETIERDILEAAQAGPICERVFLCDGDALILGQDKLVRILEAIRTRLPWVSRVSTYGDCRSILRKSVDELRALAALGLSLVYHGVESGDDVVLERIRKGSTRADAIAAAQRLKEAGITHSVIALLGLGGRERTREHPEATASLLTEMDPPFAAALTLTVVPGTALWEQQARGDFVLPGKFELLQELATLLERAAFTRCRFSSNHASNYLPLRADLPAQKEQMLAAVRAVLAARDDRLLKPEWLRGL